MKVSVEIHDKNSGKTFNSKSSSIYLSNEAVPVLSFENWDNEFLEGDNVDDVDFEIKTITVLSYK